MNLKAYRIKYRISQAALARLIGTTQANVSRIESGHRSPSPRLTRKILTVTGGEISLDDLRPDFAALNHTEME